MSKSQFISSLKICECPFCGSIVEADISQIFSQPATHEEVNIDLRKSSDPRLLIFDRNRRAAAPCQHVVDLTVSGWIAPTRSGENAPYQFYSTWKHKWLLKHDADEILLPFSWEVLDEDDLEAFRPASLHHRELLEGVECHLRKPDGVMRLSGDLFTAERPVKYFQELQACYRRHLQQSG